jgi:hypothetical protein
MQSPPSPRRSDVRVEPSFKQLRRAKAVEDQRWQVQPGRTGILGTWLNLAAPPPISALATYEERERQRKAELSAYVALGVIIIGLALIPNALQHAANLYAIPAIFALGVGAAILNRKGFTRTAAVILISVFFVSIGGAMAASAYLDLMWIPALDFFAVPVFLSGLLLSRRAPFAATAVGAAATVALLMLKPRDAWLGQMVHQLGVYHFMIRPIALMLIVAIASWLWGRSVEQAILRADRAEEVAAMEHQLAEQKRQLDRGIQNLLETHVRASNGDFSARAATNQDNVLWQIAVSLNNLLSRMGKYGNIEQRLGRTEAEIDRLAVAVESARAGRHPNWPLPSGTRVDQLISLLSNQPQTTRHHIAPLAYPAEPARGQAMGPNGPHNATGGHTGAITGKWREVSGPHDIHSASAESQTEQLRSAPWAWSQPGSSPAEPPRHAAPANHVPDYWQSATRRERASGTAGWEIPPPPLAPVPDAVRADLAGQAQPPSQNGHPPRSGAQFFESFPGQLREGASWEDLRDLRAVPPTDESQHAEPSAEDSQWPDWPAFLRDLNSQGGD